MLEGGGTFNGEVLRAGLVDEISQVVVPVVDGGRGVTTIFDIPGDPPRKAASALRLKSHRKLPGGVSWFRYRVLGVRPISFHHCLGLDAERRIDSIGDLVRQSWFPQQVRRAERIRHKLEVAHALPERGD